MLTKRLSTTAMIFATVMLLVSGCGPAVTPEGTVPVEETEEVQVTDTAPVEETEEVQVTDTAPPVDEELVIAVASDTGSEFDPMFGGGSEAENEFGKNLRGQWFQYARVETDEGYLKVDPTEFTGDLIESWEIEPDNRTIHHRVRQGLTFHDTGDEVTAEDLRAWVDRSFKTHSAGEWILNTAQVFTTTQMTIVGPYEFTIELSNPTPLYFPLMRDQSSTAINSKAVEAAMEAGDEHAKEYFIENDGAPGPYKMTSRVAGVETVLEWDDTYWMEEPYFTKVVLKVIPSASDRALLLQRGEVDIAKGLSSDELTGLRGVPGVKVWSMPARDQAMFGLLHDHPPFDDVMVRRAIAHAVPYEDILEGAFGGQGSLSSGGPVPVESAYQTGTEWPYQYDLDRAAELLEEAGLAGGFQFTCGVNAAKPETETMAVLIQAELSKLGVTMDIQRDPEAVYNEKQFNSEYDAWLDSMNAFVDSPYYYLFIFYKSDIYCCNFMNYSSSRVDEITGMLATETDPDEIMRLWEEAVELMIDDVAAVFLVDKNFQLATLDNIGGLVLEPDSLLSYVDLYRTE